MEFANSKAQQPFNLFGILPDELQDSAAVLSSSIFRTYNTRRQKERKTKVIKDKFLAGSGMESTTSLKGGIFAPTVHKQDKVIFPDADVLLTL